LHDSTFIVKLKNSICSSYQVCIASNHTNQNSTGSSPSDV